MMRYTYLVANGEERATKGIHENNFTIPSRDIVVYSKYKVSVGVEHCKSIAIEEKRLLPNGEDHRIVTRDGGFV